MANANLFRTLVQNAARAGSTKKPKPSSTIGPTPRASTRARTVANQNARFLRSAGSVQGPTKRMKRPRRGVTQTRRSYGPYGR